MCTAPVACPALTQLLSCSCPAWLYESAVMADGLRAPIDLDVPFVAVR